MEQVDEGIKFVDGQTGKEGKEYIIDVEELDKATGVGVVVTFEEIQAAVKQAFDSKMDEIMTKKYDFNFGPFLTSIREKVKWADGA